MLRFIVTNKRERQSFDHLTGPIEFGRGPERDNVARCVINDGYVSKDHVRVEEAEPGQVKIDNLSSRNSIRLPDNSVIDKGESRKIKAPVRLTVGETVIDIELVIEQVGSLATIAAPVRLSRGGRPSPAGNDTARLAAAATMPESQSAALADIARSPSLDKLMQWFETFVTVQRAAAGSHEFFQQAAEAVVRLIGLDRGLVIVRAPRGPTAPAGGPAPRWMVAARFPDDGNTLGREFSLTILERVLKDRRTYFQTSSSVQASSESLQGVEAVVASPVFDAQDNVAGFVYGCRTRFRGPQLGVGVGELEAQVMQVLASSVATGLARQQHEAEAARARIQFEQFFSPELAQELQNNPAMLAGQERVITVLFTDVRGFSRLSEAAGPQLTCELAADIMDRLTACVRQYDGTVVDFAGDGMIAMWNAPGHQPDHAARACRAALAIQAALPQLNADWADRVQGPIKIGIGINTGPAMVGNTGSRSRFKYGPLGHTVNLASRVEGATKQLGVPVLVTGSTRDGLGDGFALRRLCKVRVVGIQGTVELYELFAEQAPPEWAEKRSAYEKALELYEAAQFGPACRHVYPLLAGPEGHYDMPCLNLVTRAVEAIKNPPEKFDGVFELSSK